MTTEEALLKLTDSTADAIVEVLRMFCAEGVERAHANVVPRGVPPLKQIPVPAVAASVSYIDGVTGGNIFVMTRVGVQRLAAAMMGMDPAAVEENDELSELELSAAGEAMNQMMAAAAAATSVVLGEEVEIGPPETRFFTTPDEAEEVYETTPHTTTVGFTLLGEPCRLVQLVPNAFIVRMTRALAELAAETAGSAGTGGDGGGGVHSESIRRVPVRVWAELGRTRMPVGQAVGLPPGAVVDLTSAPDDPVRLFVNGRCFATGRLLLVENEWAVRVDEVLAGPHMATDDDQGGTN
jgi:flagellar motor switch protein FliN/FliY